MAIYVMPKTNSIVPRWHVRQNDKFWDKFTDQWTTEERGTLYADIDEAALDAQMLIERAARNKTELTLATLGVSVEVYSDKPLDTERLKQWLMKRLHVSLDVSSGLGPTPDSVVIVKLRFDKFKKIPLETES